MNDRPTWEQLEAIQLQQPKPLIDYAIWKQLTSHPDWKWTKEFAKAPGNQAQIVKAFLATAQKGPKYKFGIKVPRSITHALLLDRKNGNHLWQDAIETELKQINTYKTF